jgi:hypothetical protein
VIAIVSMGKFPRGSMAGRVRVVARRAHLYGSFNAYSVAFLLPKSGRNPMMGRVPLSNSRRRRSGEPCGKQAHAYWPEKA